METSRTQIIILKILQNQQASTPATAITIADMLPCRLGLSVGVVLCDRQDERSLEACIQDADAQMYQRKKRRKAGRWVWN